MQGRGSEQRPIGWLELWPRNLPAQDLELVPKHQQLDVFHVQSAAASNKRADQSPNGEVEERESHAADPPSPRPEEERHEYWRPSGEHLVDLLNLASSPFG